MTMRRVNMSSDVLGWDKPGSNLIATTVSGIYAGLIPGSSALYAVNTRNDGTPTVSLLECKYFISGANTGYQPGPPPVPGALSPAYNVRLLFENLPDCFLGQNADSYFGGEIMSLRIIWNAGSKIFYLGALQDGTGAATPYTGGCTISNLIFYYAVKTNPVIENMIKAKVASAEGLQMLIPSVYYNKLSILNGVVQTCTTRYNSAHGLRLKKIYWAPYNIVNNSITAYDHSNLASAKVLQFYTMVNNMRTSQYDYNVANLDDYTAKKNSLRGSCIYSSNEYYYNWV